MLPVVLNDPSEAQLVALMHKYFLPNFITISTTRRSNIFPIAIPYLDINQISCELVLSKYCPALWMTVSIALTVGVPACGTHFLAVGRTDRSPGPDPSCDSRLL